MRRVKRSSELLWLFGIVFVAFGVAICSKSDLGVSMIAAPAFVIHEFVSLTFGGLTVGVTEYIIQGILLVILCIAVKRFNWRYLLAFAVAVIYGYTLDLFIILLKDITFDTLAVRWIMLIIGDAVTAFGVACFFRTYMPLQVYELFVAEIAGCYELTTGKVKWVFDAVLLILSVLLAFVLFGDAKSFELASIGYKSFHSIGLGTLVTTLINSPLITLMGKVIDRLFDPSARFAPLEKALLRK